VQVDPIKPTLKAPGTQRLKPRYDESVPSFAFNFNLRRYKRVIVNRERASGAYNMLPYLAAGAYTRSLQSST
jgi:hypothetical protein